MQTPQGRNLSSSGRTPAGETMPDAGDTTAGGDLLELRM